MSAINFLNTIMSKNRLNEIEGGLTTGDIGIDNSDQKDDQYETPHGDTINKLLIAMLLILMAIIGTFMAIIMRNLRISELLLHLYMKTFNHMTE